MGIDKDRVEGRAKEAGGKIQEEFGKVTGNKTQEMKGKVHKAEGTAQAKFGDVTEKVKDVLKKP